MERSPKTVEKRKVESLDLVERLLPSNLRGRFLAVLFGVLLPSLTLFGVLHHDSVKRSLLNEVDLTLMNKAFEIEKVVRGSEVRSYQDFSKLKLDDSALILAAVPEVYVHLVTQDGDSLWASQNLFGKSIPFDRGSVSDQPTFKNIVQPDGLKLRRYIKPVVLDGEIKIAIVLAESITHIEKALEGSIGRTMILGLVVLSLTEVLGNLAFRNIFYPLRQLVDTAESIVSTDDVTKRVPVYFDSDAEIRRTALAFNSLMDRVEHLLEVAKQLLADTSHELRNPLTALMTDLDLLRENLSKEQREEVVSEAQNTVRRLTRLVSDLLLLSRTEASSQKLELEEVDVNILTERVVVRLSRSLPDQGKIKFLTDLEGDDAEAILDSQRMEQILTNLIENAIRYSGADQVQVRLGLEDKSIVFSVKDTGCGIAPEDQERIFYRFYRVDRSRDRHSGGTGLGLPVARALARLHGGDITLSSELGRGSDFKVKIPIKSSAS